MGVYIKGMEMPKGCSECPLEDAYDGYNCRIVRRSANWGLDERPSWCPLVPVPAHGRLIDADAMRASMPPCFTMEEICKAFKDAPTIIPADHIVDDTKMVNSEEGAKAEEDTEPWLCLSCRHYPPSSTEGKPCTQCNPSEVWHSCYDPAEEGE